jgi:UDP:flavonoid glycosyltransferase YjiC (YdhE family)
MVLNEEKCKIVFLVIPYSGHVNCTLPLVSELVTKHNAHAIFCGIEPHREQIQSAGAEYRPYSYYPLEFLQRKSEKEESEHVIFQILGRTIDVAYHILPGLVQMVKSEQPDCIVYDSFTSYAKFLREILINEHKTEPFKMPKFVSFSSVFAIKNGTFPTHEEMVQTGKILSPQHREEEFMLSLKQMMFNKSFGLDFKKSAEFNAPIPNLVAVIPEIQPRAYFFAKTHTFIGFCINEKFRPASKHANTRELDSILDDFHVINPSYLVKECQDADIKLVYVALGTLFYKNIEIYLNILEAIRLMDSKSLCFVIATGEEIYNMLQLMARTNEFFIPERVVLVPFAPQIELLKRASVFITHSGLNSTSEAIYYAVPMVCLPIQADQPYVAMRMEELGIGKKIDFKKLDKFQLAEAIRELFTNKNYLENVIKYSKLSREYDGSARAANLIMNYIQS